MKTLENPEGMKEGKKEEMKWGGKSKVSINKNVWRE